jgi:hypothetical protein
MSVTNVNAYNYVNNVLYAFLINYISNQNVIKLQLTDLEIFFFSKKITLT